MPVKLRGNFDQWSSKSHSWLKGISGTLVSWLSILDAFVSPSWLLTKLDVPARDVVSIRRFRARISCAILLSLISSIIIFNFVLEYFLNSDISAFVLAENLYVQTCISFKFWIDSFTVVSLSPTEQKFSKLNSMFQLLVITSNWNIMPSATHALFLVSESDCLLLDFIYRSLPILGRSKRGVLRRYEC